MKTYSLVGDRIFISASLYKYEDDLHKFSVRKEADTIEELCDCFIIEGDNLEFDYQTTLLGAEIYGTDNILESNETYTIYGCILVKGKGLIYVAKMNEKGKLELL